MIYFLEKNKIINAPVSCMLCVCCQVKEDICQGRLSENLHVDPSGLVTLTTANRVATVGVRAIPLPRGKIWSHTDTYVAIF